MSSNISDIRDICCSYQVCHWSFVPGREFQQDYTRNQKQAQDAFKRFTDQIPIVKGLIYPLIQQRHISEVHLPLQLVTIFFVFLDESVEVYQSQLEEKDLAIEAKLLDLKRLCAKRINDCWDKGFGEVNGFCREIKGKLKREGVLPPKFDEIVAVWIQILSIKRMGNLFLAALYHEDCAKTRFISTNEKIKGDINDLLVVSKHMSFAWLSRGSIEQSFCLLLRQIERDASWVLPEMLEKMAPIEDEKLELDLRKISATRIPGSAEIFGMKDPVSSRIVTYEKKFKEFINNPFLIDVNSHLSFDEMFVDLSDHSIVCTIPIGTTVDSIKDMMRTGNTLLGVEGLGVVEISDALYQCANNYNDCCLFKKTFMDGPLSGLANMKTSLITSNEIWNKFKEGKTEPMIYSRVFPLLPPITHENVNDDWIDSLESTPQNGNKGQIQPRSKRKVWRNPPTPKKAILPRPINPMVDIPIPDLKAAHSPPLKPLELLLSQLIALHMAAPSPALRQALWHLGALRVIQSSLPKSKINAFHCLSVAVIVASSSQKLLEQTYRFCLKKDNAPLERNHDLKIYHREFEPGCASFPSVVKKLFLANTWCRYFYSSHEKWQSLSMNLAQPPPLLTKLVKIAKGQALSPVELNTFVEETIEDVCAHTEFLLKSIAMPPAQEIFASELLESKEPLFPKVSFKGFNLVSKSLEDILAKAKFHSNHPILLCIKQSLAALKMFTVSQEKISQAKKISAFATWTTFSLQQLQESVENVLHAIEQYQKGTTSIDHEMGKLAATVGLDMGTLADLYHNLSYKVRYPAEVIIDSLPAQIIDDLEVLKLHPEILEGFQLQHSSALLWAKPTEGISLEAIAKNLNACMVQTEEFLRLKAIPALQKCFVC